MPHNCIRRNVPGDQEALERFNVGLARQIIEYEKVVDLGIKEAQDGAAVTHDIVYLLDRLVDSKTRKSEIEELLDELHIAAGRMQDVTAQLMAQLSQVHHALEVGLPITKHLASGIRHLI